MTTFLKLEQIRTERGAVAIALLDPDIKNDNVLLNMLQLVNESDFDTEVSLKSNPSITFSDWMKLIIDF